MKKLLAALLLTCTACYGTEFTLWNSQTFSGPYTNGDVAISSVIANNNELSSIRIVIKYESGLPAGCGCEIRAILEEEIAAGVWVALAYQFEFINTGLNANTRIIELTPAFNLNEGTDNFIDVNGGIRVSKSQGSAASKMRVRIVTNTFSGGAGLSSLTVSAYGRLFD